MSGHTPQTIGELAEQLEAEARAEGHAALTLPDLLAERDRLRAINSELVAALEKAKAAVWDAHYGSGISVGYARAVDEQARAALDRAKKG